MPCKKLSQHIKRKNVSLFKFHQNPSSSYRQRKSLRYNMELLYDLVEGKGA